MSTGNTGVLCPNCGQTTPARFTECVWCKATLQATLQPEAPPPEPTQTLRARPRGQSAPPPQSKQSSSLGRNVIAVFVVVVILILLAEFGKQGTGTGGGSSSPASQDNAPLEYKMAVINAGGYVSPDDITVTRFRYLLDLLSSKTGNTRQQIADFTVVGQNDLRTRYGKDIKLLDLMEAANSSIPDGTTMGYEGVMAAVTAYYGQR